MATAVDKFQDQMGDPLLPVTLTEGIDYLSVDNFLLDVVNKAGLQGFDVGGSITDGFVNRTMDGASTLSVTVFDPYRNFLGSALWGYALEVEFGGLWWRLRNVQKDGDHITMVFEDRIAVWLKEHKEPKKISRNKMTRAEFLQYLVSLLRIDNKAGLPIHFYAIELHKKQPIATPEDRKKEATRRAARDGGLNAAAGLKVKGHAATGEQIRTGERVLDVGEHSSLNRKCMVALVMIANTESEMTNLKGGDADSRGVFQQQKYINGRRTSWPASGKIEPDAKGCADALKKADKANPNLTLPMLCQTVQRSAFPDGSNYAKWEDEAKEWVEAYGGGADGSITRQFYEQEQFTVGPPKGPKGETWWAAAQRLAIEVRWRFFTVGNYIYYMSDTDLLKSKPVMIIDDNDPGIEDIDGDLMDDGKPATELSITCRLGAWDGDPGEVVQLKSTMGPGAGKWIIWTIHQPFFTDKTTITIKRPQDPKKEPAPTLTSSSTDAGRIYSGGTVDGDGLRDKIVNAAKMALSSKYHYHYLQKRPFPKSLFSAEAQAGIDCSAFATLVYKAAGADDPNGFGFNGTGNTQTLMSNGKKTGTPSRGDLVFYRSPEHVGVYIGDGKIIEMGGDPGPKEVDINYRNDLIGVYTYNLDPNNHPSVTLTEHHRTGK